MSNHKHDHYERAHKIKKTFAGKSTQAKQRRNGNEGFNSESCKT